MMIETGGTCLLECRERANLRLIQFVAQLIFIIAVVLCWTREDRERKSHQGRREEQNAEKSNKERQGDKTQLAQGLQYQEWKRNKQTKKSTNEFPSAWTQCSSPTVGPISKWISELMAPRINMIIIVEKSESVLSRIDTAKMCHGHRRPLTVATGCRLSSLMCCRSFSVIQ